MTKEEIEAYAEEARKWIRDNPLIAVGAGLALGLLLAKLLSKKTVYLEKK